MPTITLNPASQPLTLTAGAASTDFIPAYNIDTALYLGPTTGPFAGVYDAVFIRVSHPDGLAAQIEFSLDNFATVKTVAVDTAVPNPWAGELDTPEGPVGVGVEASGTVLVYVLQSAATKPQLWFRIIDQNSGPISYRYVVVAGSSEGEASRPWIHTNAALDFDAANGAGALANQPVNADIEIWNLGTGDLVLEAPASGDLGDGFTLLDTSSATILAGGPPDVRTVSFDGTVGQHTTTWTIAGDDGAIAGSAGHNHQVSLTASAGELELVFVLDASGSMSLNWQGVTPAGGDATRWTDLDTAVELCLRPLGQIAEGAGKLSVIIFPDRTTTPIVNTSNKICMENAAISADPFQDLRASEYGGINVTDIYGRTPLTNAILVGVGISSAAAGDYGLFDPSSQARAHNHRFLVVMTDGVNNEGADLAILNETGQKGDWFPDKSVNLITVPYGPAGAANANPEALALITEAAQDTDAGTTGTFVAAQAIGFSGPTIQQAFKSALAQAVNLTFTSDPAAVLTPGHPIVVQSVHVTPYDQSITVLVRREHTASSLAISLITPDGKVLDEALMRKLPHIDFIEGRYVTSITVQREFLGDRHDPANLNWGTWNLRIECDKFANQEVEQISWDVLIRSGLRLDVQMEIETEHVGAPIELVATMQANGLPLRGATVTASLERPLNDLIQFIAKNQPSAKSLRAAQEQLGHRDSNGVAIKQYALELDGLKFVQANSSSTVSLVDAKSTGVYTGTAPFTGILGTYHVYVTGVGVTPEGSRAYRRERAVNIQVVMRPDPAYSSLTEQWAFENGVTLLTLAFTPMDAYGNLMLFDPAFTERIVFESTVGSWTGPVKTAFDGTYLRTLRFREGERPIVSVMVDGRKIVNKHAVPVASCIRWARKILQWREGREGKKGINRHDDPKVVLGDPWQGKPSEFLALGGKGQVSVTFEMRYISSDAVIVVAPEREERRSYQVEVMTLRGTRPCWICVGTSPGGTTTFELSRIDRPVLAARVTDLSNRTVDEQGRLSVAPGAAVLGIGLVPRLSRP